jgi:hypothetical protein
VIGLAAAMVLAIQTNLPAQTEFIVPFFKSIAYPLGVIGFIAMTYFVIVGTSNAVNLTDGLDGLAIMPTVMVGAALGIFAYVCRQRRVLEISRVPVHPGAGELTVFCAALAGAGLAFLWFNAYPAEVFMGDVGALALGAALGNHRGDRAPGNRALHHGRGVRRRDAVRDAAGGVIQAHRQAHLPNGAAAPPLTSSRAGRRTRSWCASGSSP